MPGFTAYFVDKVMDHCLAGASWTPPAALYAQLHTGDPGPDGTANVAATNTRKAITWDGDSSNGQLATSGLNWVMSAKETISHVSVWDSATSGHAAFTAELEEAKNLFLGDTFDLPSLTAQIPPGA